METCIYKGFVTHRRFKPLRHYFSYKTFSILFDLTELEDLHKKIGIFYKFKGKKMVKRTQLSSMYDVWDTKSNKHI